MKKRLTCLSVLVLIASVAAGCNEKKTGQGLTEIADHIFEVETYNSLDYDYADEFWAKDNDNWGGGCSAVTKMIDGHRIVGRNMDLNISHKCAYIVRTNTGKHQTMALAYTFRDYSPDYVDVKKDGIDEHFSKILPFMCDDVMNETGFHVEVNMRHGEVYPTGEDMFAVESTNPEGTRRVHMFELPRYLAENCTTVEEAKEYIKTLDIYSKNGYWNYCFIIADATGKASLLEFADTGLSDFLELGYQTINWIDEEDLASVDWLKTGAKGYETPYTLNAIAQCNFYINKYAFLRQDTRSGEGRFLTIQNDIVNVKSKDDMYNLMKKVSYSNFYKEYDDCKEHNFDPRTENVGEMRGLTYDLLMQPSYENKFKEFFNDYTEPIRNMTREQKMNDNKYWESTFTEVVDCMDKSIMVRMFENKDLKFNITFNGIERLPSDVE